LFVVSRNSNSNRTNGKSNSFETGECLFNILTLGDDEADVCLPCVENIPGATSKQSQARILEKLEHAMR
jgi:hypothetical protein